MGTGNHKKIRVMQIIHGLHIGGAEKVVASLCRHFDPERFELIACWLNIRGDLADVIGREGIPVVSPVDSTGTRFGKLFGLGHLIREVQPDIVHSHGTTALLHVGLLTIRQQFPIFVHTFHFGNYPHIRRRYMMAERILARRADQLIAVSDAQRRAVIKHHGVTPGAVIVIPNGAPPNEYLGDEDARRACRAEFDVDESTVLIGCVAVLSEQKGVDVLLKAVRRIVANRQNIRFVIVGGGPLLDSLLALTDEYGVADIVTFTGWRNDVARIMTAVDVFVMPSLWEGLPVVLLEAMAAKRAIVVTDVGDNAQVIRANHSGLVVEPGDSEALIRAIGTLIDDEGLRRRLAQEAYMEYQRYYTVEAMVGSHDRLYSNLMCHCVKPAQQT